jgi:hypothetical protein
MLELFLEMIKEVLGALYQFIQGPLQLEDLSRLEFPSWHGDIYVFIDFA